MPFPKPRTEMTCTICGGFSSATRCWSCTSSSAYPSLVIAEVRIQELEKQVEELQEQLQREKEKRRCDD